MNCNTLLRRELRRGVTGVKVAGCVVSDDGEKALLVGFGDCGNGEGSRSVGGLLEDSW